MSGKVKTLSAAIILLIIALFWSLFFNGYFVVDNIIIEGSQRIDEYKIYNIVGDQLNKSRFIFFNQSNIFLLSKRQLKKEIYNNYFVDNLKIKRDLPRTIIASFTEIEPAAVWTEEDRYYYIDGNFNILTQVESLEIDANSFTVLQSAAGGAEIVKEGLAKKVGVGEEYLRACLNLVEKSKSSGLAIDNKCEVHKIENSVSLNISNGPKLHFNIKEDLGSQFKKLEVLISEKLPGEKLLRLEYIDLRFGEKIYYK